MNAGELDRRIVVQRFTTTQNALNESIKAWAALATVWAKVTPVSDGERFRGGEVAAAISTRFLVRWQNLFADLNARDQILYGGRTFDIHGVKEIGRREGLEISAAARAE